MREGGSSFGEAHHVSREEELEAIHAARQDVGTSMGSTLEDRRDEWQMEYPPDHLFARLPTQRVRTFDQAESKRRLAAEERTEELDIKKFEAQGATQPIKAPIPPTRLLWRESESDEESIEGSLVDLEFTRSMGVSKKESRELPVTPVIDLRGVRIGGGVIRSSEKIGEGGFGVAYRVVMEHNDPLMERMWGGRVSGDIRVLKLVEEPDPHLELRKSDTIVRETAAARLDSMHLLVDAMRLATPERRTYIAMLMELAPGEDLKEAREIFEEGTEEEIREQRFVLAVGLKALVDQLRGLHEEGWLHLDIKPGNIRFDGTFPHKSRLIDVGIARKKGQHASREGTIEGSPPYILPDALSDTWAKSATPEWRDIYALGLSFGETLGIMKIKKADNVFAQFVMASQGRLIESRDPTDRSGASPDISEPTLTEWTRAELRLARLVQAMVRPNDTREERVKAYAAWDGGKGMTMEGVAREIDEIVEEMQREREHETMTKEEVDILRQSVFEASIHEAHMAVDEASATEALSLEQKRELQTMLQTAAVQDDYDLVTIRARDMMSEIQAYDRAPEQRAA